MPSDGIRWVAPTGCHRMSSSGCHPMPSGVAIWVDAASNRWIRTDWCVGVAVHRTASNGWPYDVTSPIAPDSIRPMPSDGIGRTHPVDLLMKVLLDAIQWISRLPHCSGTIHPMSSDDIQWMPSDGIHPMSSDGIHPMPSDGIHRMPSEAIPLNGRSSDYTRWHPSAGIQWRPLAGTRRSTGTLIH